MDAIELLEDVVDARGTAVHQAKGGDVDAVVLEVFQVERFDVLGVKI